VALPDPAVNVQIVDVASGFAASLPQEDPVQGGGVNAGFTNI